MIYRLLKLRLAGNEEAINFLEACQEGQVDVEFYDHLAEMSDGIFVLTIEFCYEQEIEFDRVVSSVPMERWTLTQNGSLIAFFERHTQTRRRWYEIQQQLGRAQ